MDSTETTEQHRMGIGEVARKSGVTVSTLRYYDELGIVSPAARVSGQRRYSNESIVRIGFIRAAQRAGFSLNEIGDLLTGSSSSPEALIIRKVRELRRERDEITGIIELLEDFMRCGCGVLSDCVESSMRDSVVQSPEHSESHSHVG